MSTGITTTTAKKTVLITGGNRGLGKALVEAFCKVGGWTVLATARRPDTLPVLPSVEPFALDLSQADDVSRLAAQLKDRPVIDVIIHNAGFNPKDQKDIPGYFESTFYCHQFSADHVAESMMINALRPMELTGKLLPQLAPDGKVLAISSWLGSIGQKQVPGHYGYSGSKALLNMCIKGLSLEFEKDRPTTHRTAVAINPGWMKTDMGGSNADLTPDEVAQRILDMIVQDGFLQQHNGKFLNTDRTEHDW